MFRKCRKICDLLFQKLEVLVVSDVFLYLFWAFVLCATGYLVHLFLFADIKLHSC